MEQRINPLIRILTVLGIFALLALTSCNTEKKLAKAINKHGQKESVTYVVEKYPEYFKDFIVRDTVQVTVRDTIKIEKTVLDTTFTMAEDGTLVAENEHLKFELTKLGDKYKAVLTGKPKEIIKEKIVNVPVEVDKPCPDTEIFYQDLSKMQLKHKTIQNVLAFSILFNVLLLAILAYAAYLHSKRQGIS
jgi:hypothetical protein